MTQNSDHLVNDEDQGLSFIDIIRLIRATIRFLISRYLVISLFALFGASLGVLKYSISKSIYTAKLTYVTEGQSSSSGGLGGLATQFGFNVGGGGGSMGVFSPNNLIELMKSRALLEKVLLSTATINNQTKTLAEFYIDTEELRIKKWYRTNVYPDTIIFPLNANPSNLSIEQNAFLTSIIANIGANHLETKLKSKLSTINEMSFSSKSEEFSFIMLNKIVKELMALYVQTKTQKAKSNVMLLQFQADSIRKELNESIGAVAKNADETFNLNPALVSKKVPSSKKQIDVQANTAILGQLLQNLEMAKVTLMQETPLIQIIDEPRMPLNVTRTNLIKSVLLFSALSVFLISIFLIANKWIKSIRLKL